MKLYTVLKKYSFHDYLLFNRRNACQSLYINCLALVSQAEALKEENDSLRWQLDAYRNEVELLKQEQGKAHKEDDPNKEQQLKLLQQALQGMQQVKAFWLSKLFQRIALAPQL